MPNRDEFLIIFIQKIESLTANSIFPNFFNDFYYDISADVN